LIKAGVVTRPTAAEINSAISGVTASPTPRSIDVSRMKTNVRGIVIIMMRA
jgi:hypothetical protein